MRRITTAFSAAALAFGMVASALPANAAVAGYDSSYAGESAFLTLNPGASGSFTVFFFNIGTTTWTKGTSTQVDLAACLDDKVTCNAQDATEAPFASGWLSATKYATHTQTTVAPNGLATFTYNVAVPSTQAAGTHRFNGALVKSDTNVDIHNEGYYQDVTVPTTAAAAGLTISPATDTNQTGTDHTVTVTYVNSAGAAIANAPIDFFVVLDSDPFDTAGACKRDTDNITSNSTGADPCKVDSADPITNSDGKATFTWQSTNEKETHRVVAWTGTVGDTFDNDTTTNKVSATKTWIGAVGALNCTPETKNNPFASTHTITCQLHEGDVDETAVPLTGQTIRLEIYRLASGGENAGFEAAGNGTNGCAAQTILSTNSVTTDATGKATFTYTGPADPSTATGSRTDDCIFAWYDANNNNVRGAGADEETDTVIKDWIDAAASATTVAVTPSDDGNPTNTTHTATATVTDQFGNAVGGVTVRFSVTRTQQTHTAGGPSGGSMGVVLTADRVTGSDGKATLAYTGPTFGADDSIGAEADKDADGVFNEADDPEDASPAIKHWAPEATGDNDNYTGTILFCDTANDTVYVSVTGNAAENGNRRFVYDSGDQFNVGGVASTMANWETECSDNDDPLQSYTYNPGGVSVFNNGTND